MEYKDVQNVEPEAGFFLVIAAYYNNEKSTKEGVEETGRPVL
jgi:hypothetical protein